MRPQILGGFDTFIDRKSRAAAAAELPPYRTELERPLDGMLAIGSPWTERLFDGPFYLSPLPQRLRVTSSSCAWVRGLHDSLQPYAEGVYVNNLEDEGEE